MLTKGQAAEGTTATSTKEQATEGVAVFNQLNAKGQASEDAEAVSTRRQATDEAATASQRHGPGSRGDNNSQR